MTHGCISTIHEQCGWQMEDVQWSSHSIIGRTNCPLEPKFPMKSLSIQENLFNISIRFQSPHLSHDKQSGQPPLVLPCWSIHQGLCWQGQQLLFSYNEERLTLWRCQAWTTMSALCELPCQITGKFRFSGRAYLLEHMRVAVLPSGLCYAEWFMNSSVGRCSPHDTRLARLWHLMYFPKGRHSQTCAASKAGKTTLSCWDRIPNTYKTIALALMLSCLPSREAGDQVITRCLQVRSAIFLKQS